MIILEKNPLLVDMLAYIKEHIAASDFDPAANTLRKIGEHMAKRLIIEARLWDEACTDKNGNKYDEPNFSRSIYLLNKNHIIKRQEYDEVYNPLLKFGNAGSHTVGDVENYEVIYAYEKTKKYVESVFLTKYSDAARHGILPIPGSSRSKSKPETSKPTTVQHMHTRGSWKTTKAPTCTTQGEETVVCTSCGKLLDKRTIPKKEHTPSGWIIDYPATAGKNGRKHQECKTCGMRLSIADIPALPGNLDREAREARRQELLERKRQIKAERAELEEEIAILRQRIAQREKARAEKGNQEK